jgi:integral membrane protein
MGLLKTELGRLRIIAFVEGVSFLVILFITMPLKYIFDYPQANMAVGMIHGLLFMLYILVVLRAKFAFDWSWKTLALALLASIIPFGTFWADKKLFKANS